MDLIALVIYFLLLYTGIIALAMGLNIGCLGISFVKIPFIL
jgi:hypothetical protein